MECVVIPVVVVLILTLIIIIVLLVALFWYIQKNSRNSPDKQIQLKKVDKKTAAKDVENVISNVHAVSRDVTTESAVKTDAV